MCSVGVYCAPTAKLHVKRRPCLYFRNLSLIDLYPDSLFTSFFVSYPSTTISLKISPTSIVHTRGDLSITKMPYATLFRGSSPLTAEDVEADRRYREALARRPSSAPSTPVNSRDNRPSHSFTWDLQQSGLEHGDSSVPPSPPSSSSSASSPQESSPQMLPSLDTEPSRERIPPPHITVVTNITPCADCGEEYAPDQVWNILNAAMTIAPSAYARKDWDDANYEDRWAPYLRSLTGLQLVKEGLDAICAQCILDWVSKVQGWPWYDVERRVWSWAHARTGDVLST